MYKQYMTRKENKKMIRKMDLNEFTGALIF